MEEQTLHGELGSPQSIHLTTVGFSGHSCDWLVLFVEGCIGVRIMASILQTVTLLALQSMFSCSFLFIALHHHKGKEKKEKKKNVP